MHKCIVAFSILLTPAIWAQPVKMTAKSSNLSKPAKSVTLPKPTQGSNSPQSSQYSFDFSDANTAPLLGGRWVTSERIVVQKGTIVFAQFVFAQSGSAPIIAAVQQQYGAPKLAGNSSDVLASWTAANNVIVVSGDNRPTLTIEDKQYMSSHQ